MTIIDHTTASSHSPRQGGRRETPPLGLVAAPSWAREVEPWLRWEDTWTRVVSRAWSSENAGTSLTLFAAQTCHDDGHIETTPADLELSASELESPKSLREISQWINEAAEALERAAGHGRR